ncbi:hypothetical protein LLH23_03060 [bacterium]|nr:hypothetical protein [bacterium]
MRRTIVLLALAAVAGAASAQPVALPRAQAAVSLLDPANLGLWSGLKVTAATLDGQPAMQFTFPKYVPGQNEWPAVYLKHEEGKGYSLSDWSHHALISFDVRTDSEKAADVALELRAEANRNGWATHYPIAPGKTNHIAVALSDLPRDFGLTHVQEIVFFTTRPAAAYTVTIANLRVEPGEKPPLATVSLAYPNYRQIIFPQMDGVRVAVKLQPEEYAVKPSALKLALTGRGGGKQVSADATLRQAESVLTVSTHDLPAGRVTLTATVTGGPEPVVLRQTLRKLSADEARSLRVYIDEHNNTVVDGKPFFPLGLYGNGQAAQMREIADSPFNCLLDYGTNRKSRADMLAYLDEMQQRGLKLIYCLNDLYPAAKYYEGKTWEGVSGNAAIADAVIEAYRDHPALLAWYLNDELPKAMVPELTGYYRQVREADPNHPAYIVLCNMAEVKYFTGTTDVMGVDPYPIPTLPVTRVSDWMETANEATQDHMPTWLVPQAFAWYQHHPPGSNRARIPTAEELRTGRAPTYEEGRCMTYLALAHGAKGLVYWCYYNLRMLPQYQEMWGWMKQIAAEVKELSPVLMAPDDLGPARFTPAAAPLHTKVKRYRGHEYLIAVNAGQEPCEITFATTHTLPAQVTVMFENRTTPASGRQLKLAFKPLEVHVLDLGPVGR